MLKIENLHKGYKSFQVLNGLNMTINKGDVYGFLGKNGCGKTTTLSIICNIIPKDDGNIIIDELETGSKKRPFKMGYLPESPTFLGYMNAYEYLEYIASCASYKGNVAERTKEVLTFVDLAKSGTRRIKGYSRGMNQRLGVAAAIFDNPDLLILDEPTSALDPEGRAELMGIIKSLSAGGTTILLCTHILSDVERVANKVGILSNGIMQREGTIESLCNSTNSGGIMVELFENTPQTFEIMNQIRFADSVSFKNNVYTLSTGNTFEATSELMKFLAVSNFVPKRIEAVHKTLEDIYIETVGQNAVLI